MTESDRGAELDNKNSKQVTMEELHRMHAGDENTWSEVLSRLTPYLKRVASNAVGRKDADDIIQDAWLSVFRRFDDPEFSPKDLLGYLSRTITRKGIDEFRRQGRHPEDSVGLTIADTASPNARPIDDQVADKLRATAALRTVVKTVGISQAQVLYLQALGFLTNEIAKLQGVSEGTVKSRASRGRGVVSGVVYRNERKRK